MQLATGLLIGSFMAVLAAAIVPASSLLAPPPVEGALVLRAVSPLGSGARDEISGIVQSKRTPGLYWTLNDSGNSPSVYPIRSDGSLAGNPITIEGATNRDWEAIALDASGRLIIADVGNNSNARKNLCLYLIDEPDPKATTAPRRVRITVGYPDQPAFPAPATDFNYDAEAVFTVGDDIFILSKNRSDTWSKLYQLTDRSESEVNVLTYVDRFDLKGRATAADASPDGLKLVVLTYDAVWLFERENLSTPFFAGRVSTRAYAYEEGRSDSESICFASDGALLVADERRGCVTTIALSELKPVRESQVPPESAFAPRGDVTVASFNIRYASANDDENVWSLRRPRVERVLDDLSADIIGLQEVEASQADWLRTTYPDYTFHGCGRADGERKGEFAPIMFRTDTFDLLESGHFWLSLTPEVAGSKGWDGACERMASWVRLRHQATNTRMLVLNTHLDHVGQLARANGLALIRERITALAGPDAVIVTGDFNLSADSDLARSLFADAQKGPVLRDTFRTLFAAKDIDEATFCGWSGTTIAGDRIDWILASDQLAVRGAAIIRTAPMGKPASDHYPVLSHLGVLAERK